MKVITFLALFFFSMSHASFAQTTDSLNDKLVGYWTLHSVKFKMAVDINKDGVKSEDAIDEYTPCQKDQQLELSQDMTAHVYSGTHVKDCQAKDMAYTWKVVKRTVRDSRYENGKRIINDHVILVLILKANAGNESMQFTIGDAGKKKLTVRTELRDGTDSTSEAEIEYKKTKK